MDIRDTTYAYIQKYYYVTCYGRAIKTCSYTYLTPEFDVYANNCATAAGKNTHDIHAIIPLIPYIYRTYLCCISNFTRVSN